MKTTGTLLLAIAFSLSSLPSASGQEPAPQNQADVVRVRTNEVKLDVVVKDKKGRPVKDLTASDFEVYEDGVPQRIESFRFVMSEATTAGNVDRSPDRKEAKAEPTLQPTAQNRATPGVTALVFDRLSPGARALARKAGIAYAQEGMAAG